MLGRVVAAVRRNHALEHATIAVLMRRLGPNARMVGRATPGGFYIYGEMPEEAVEESAREGLARLKSGEAHLAVSALCGTNLAVAGVMAGLAALAVSGGRNRWERMPTTLLSSMLAVLAAQPVGRWLQKNFTTSADVSGLEIMNVRHAGQGMRHFHKVETSQG